MPRSPVFQEAIARQYALGFNAAIALGESDNIQFGLAPDGAPSRRIAPNLWKAFQAGWRKGRSTGLQVQIPLWFDPAPPAEQK